MHSCLCSAQPPLAKLSSTCRAPAAPGCFSPMQHTWRSYCTAWTVGAACWLPFAVHPLDMSYFSTQKLVATDIFYEMESHLYLGLTWTQILLPLKCWVRMLGSRLVPQHLLQRDLIKRPCLLSPSKWASLLFPSKTLSLSPALQVSPIISLSRILLCPLP